MVGERGNSAYISSDHATYLEVSTSVDILFNDARPSYVAILVLKPFYAGVVIVERSFSDERMARYFEERKRSPRSLNDNPLGDQ